MRQRARLERREIRHPPRASREGSASRAFEPLRFVSRLNRERAAIPLEIHATARSRVHTNIRNIRHNTTLNCLMSRRVRRRTSAPPPARERPRESRREVREEKTEKTREPRVHVPAPGPRSARPPTSPRAAPVTTGFPPTPHPRCTCACSRTLFSERCFREAPGTSRNNHHIRQVRRSSRSSAARTIRTKEFRNICRMYGQGH